MRKLAPLVLGVALAASVVGTASPAAAATDCNYPPGAVHYVSESNGNTSGAKGTILALRGQAKFSGRGTGCTGATLQLRYANFATSTQPADREYRTFTSTSTARPNGYFTFRVPLAKSFKYYFQWDYSDSETTTTANAIHQVIVT
jgi:hypothetical protein